MNEIYSRTLNSINELVIYFCVACVNILEQGDIDEYI